MAGLPWRRLLLTLLVGLVLGGCGEDPDIASGGSPGEQSAESTSGAVTALYASELPADEESLLRVLEKMPAEMLGRTKEHSGGDVVYRAEGAPDLLVSAMEAEDVGTGAESNRELLEIEAQAEGRTVTDRNTDATTELLYIRGTEAVASEFVHFMAWAAPEGPFLFAAGADTAEHLDAVVEAFAEATEG